jgi:hypothetical protein
LVDDTELDSEDDDADVNTSVEVPIDDADDAGVVSAEESEVGAGEADSDPEEVSTGIEDTAEDPSTELAEAEEVLSHPPQIVSPGTQIVVMVVETTVLVAKLVLRFPVAVDKIGLIVQEIQSDGRPDGTWTCL